MEKYKISTKEKNQIVETEFYFKDVHQVKINMAYRSGWVITTDKVILNSYNPKVGIDVQSLELEDHSFDDGRGDDIEFPDTLPEEEKDRLTNIYYEFGTEGLEDEGWEHDDTEVWFFGELQIEKIGLLE
jgi:hypothetical protein